MKCEKCGLDLRIQESHTEVTGDNTPEQPTRVYLVQQCGCVNEACEACKYKNTVDVRHLVYEGGEPYDSI